MQISISINGTPYTADVEPRTLLVHFIRETAGLTGTHIGCETSYCGACTVLLDGAAVKSCTILAVQASGGSVETVEGLTDGEGLHPVQDGFWQRHGLQCGFCTPGMQMTVKGMLDADPDPSAADIRHGLEGNLCRCTGYDNIVAAVQYAADRMRGVEPAPASWEE